MQPTYQCGIAEEQRLVRATAQHAQFVVGVSEPHRLDGSGVVIQCLQQSVVLLHVEHMNQAITTPRRQYFRA